MSSSFSTRDVSSWMSPLRLLSVELYYKLEERVVQHNDVSSSSSSSKCGTDVALQGKAYQSLQ